LVYSPFANKPKWEGEDKKTTSMFKIPSLEEMLKAGMHFGHKNSRRHPKMDQFIFTTKNTINIIDVEKTQVKLEEALNFLKDTASKGGVILFVGTKAQALPVMEKYAKECGMPYINEHWIGGIITNFSVIGKLIRKYNDLREKREKGELQKYTKWEQMMFDKEIADMARKVDGISTLRKNPDALFVVDIKNERTAVDEAVKRNIPIVAVCDTNVNPKPVSYVIPANDDAVGSIEIIAGLAAEAIKEGKANPAVKDPASVFAAVKTPVDKKTSAGEEEVKK
jgi:small subunit ribosomal protein S2